MLNNCSEIVSEAKYKTKEEKGLKISSPKQMFQRLSIVLAQVKAGHTSENLLNEIRNYLFFVSRKINY